MPKTIRNVFEKKLEFEYFLSASNRACYGKKNKKEIGIFDVDLETNLWKIIEEIKAGKYKFGDYREFKIYEPKERIIKSLPYRDRIVHQWYVEEFIKPYYLKRFYKNSFACIPNKGTHRAVKCCQKSRRKANQLYGDYYVLKCDISKFFYSIDRSILFEILKRNIKDKKLLDFTKVVIGDFNEKGIPIGNYTSQFFANIYLNELDYYIKSVLKVKLYVRYMDDFILILPSKYECKYNLEKIDEFINNRLGLKLNNKTAYFKGTCGIDFCGYIIYDNFILLRKRFKKKFKKKIKVWNKLLIKDRLNKNKYIMCYNSALAHMHHANYYNFLNKSKSKFSDNSKS